MFYDIHSHGKQCNEQVITLNSYYSPENQIPDKKLFTAGIHPMFVNYDVADALKNWITDISNKLGCVAIGEIGLDKRNKQSIALQFDLFQYQVQLANELNKPIIIHAVGYIIQIIEILKKNKFKPPFIFHGFNQNNHLAQYIVKSGGMLSFGRHLLINNSNAQKVLKQLSLNEFFLETDDSQVDIKAIYLKAAELQMISLNELTNGLEVNFFKVFNIK